MKAVLCTQHGGPERLVVADVAPPQPKHGEVVVQVHAASVNFPDTLIIEGRYQLKPALPFSPGGEVAGIVKAVGEGVGAFAAGDRVIASCGWGGFADEVVVPQRQVAHLAPGVSMEAGAALLFTYGTTHYALVDRACLQPGETLLVLGASGGTGMAAVELGTLMGARVIAAASSPEKLAFARVHAVHGEIDYSRENLRDRVRALTDGRGIDVVYDPIGGVHAEPALRAMAWGGRYLVIGFASGEIPRLPLNLPLLKGCSIVGVFYGGFADHEPQRRAALLDELMQWLALGRIRPSITSRRPIEEAAQALADMAARRVLGKVILTTAAGRGEVTGEKKTP